MADETEIPDQTSPIDLHRWGEKSLEALQGALASGELSSVELVDFYLGRIDAYDQTGPAINAIQARNKSARQIAQALDTERQSQGPRSLLHGIPVLVKDNYETTDMPTTAGSVLFAEFQPSRDATQVARLREAGAIILGKTTMHEFAYGITTVGSGFGETKNPYHLERNPGGSSGGTGAAIAANFAAVGMGSDTCGSIRIPAAQNNLVGLRGTQGLSSRAGIVPLSSTQDIGGPLAKSVRDLSIVLDATVGYDADDAQTRISQGQIPSSYLQALAPLHNARIGLLTDWHVQETDDKYVAEVVDTALSQMKTLAGWETLRLTSPEVNTSLDRPWNGHFVLIYDFKQDINRYLSNNSDLGIKDLADLLGRGMHHADITGSLTASASMESKDAAICSQEIAQRAVVREALLKIMRENNLDALAYPTIRQVATKRGREQMGTNCRLAANSGLPAISVPAGFDPEGLPVGLELLAEGFEEQKLLNLAYTIEQLYPQRRLPTHTP